jgi:hypothetical protein
LERVTCRNAHELHAYARFVHIYALVFRVTRYVLALAATLPYGLRIHSRLCAYRKLRTCAISWNAVERSAIAIPPLVRYPDAIHNIKTTNKKRATFRFAFGPIKMLQFSVRI